jgi:SAM-dependent methyltransferase
MKAPGRGLDMIRSAILTRWYSVTVLCPVRMGEAFRHGADAHRPLELPGEVAMGAPVDSVVAINLLEHLEDDVAALRSIRSAAVPGGNVVLIVPGYPALYGEYDRAVGHLRRYTPDTLRQAVEAAGLRVAVLRPVNLLGGLAWWAAVRMGGRARPTPMLVRLYDRLVVPLVRLSERRFEPPFGQSVICVARVPAD